MQVRASTTLLRDGLLTVCRYCDARLRHQCCAQNAEDELLRLSAGDAGLPPLLRPDGRLVNVCSMSGKLSSYSESIKAAFLKATETDVASVSSIMESFTTAVSEGKEKEAGFPSAAYAVSKAGEIAMTKVIAMEETKNGGKKLVNACCPGYVKTDMTRGGGVKTVDEGAKTPVLLALGDISGKTGKFWQDEKEIAW